MKLLPDIYLPGSHEDVLSNWELAHSLWKMRCLGPRFAAPSCLLALAAHTCPSASRERRTYIAAGFLSSDIHSILVLYECTRGHHVVLQSFTNVSLSLSLFGDPVVWFTILLAPSDFPQDIQAWSSP